ncbi:hypothetical protein SD70_23635 [Gordoniibacillus kamchatkensis]|uniref:Thioredoxin family protein n=1 Tax=Gordoniibacillus kamchatkensis TaxID=1590651 RepID=A0ABR5ACU8_9BACL|nr:thioredoxin family protein [Paenibacillus sp. VKM B-2647]KIL38863.1 hypothetical protein SD70_23635 [Paenibacillus sp. VKM B-2647]
MSKNIANKLGKGLKPQQFIDGMTKNKETFQSWYDQFVWTNEEDKEFFGQLQNRDDVRCVIIAADWCGDVVRNVPVVFRALEPTGMPVEVLIMEENLETIDQFLVMGGRSIPVVIFADTGGFVLGTWGPRPKYVQEPMVEFKRGNPDREAPDYQANLDAARQEIRRRYGEGRDYQDVIVRELRELISTF